MPLTKLIPPLNNENFVDVLKHPPFSYMPGEDNPVYKGIFQSSYLTFGKFNILDVFLPKDYIRKPTDYVDPSSVRVTDILLEVPNLLGEPDIVEIYQRIKFGGTGICSEIKGNNFKLGGHDLRYSFSIRPDIPPVIESINIDLSIDSRSNEMEIKEAPNTGFKVLGFCFEVLLIDGSKDFEGNEIDRLLVDPKIKEK